MNAGIIRMTLVHDGLKIFASPDVQGEIVPNAAFKILMSLPRIGVLDRA